jgi:alpha-D-ribose 1-methylphosphonate 5-triphosphate synthase subunit PhnL
MNETATPVIELAGVGKSFVMHLQGGVRLSIVSGVGFTVQPGECVALTGPSGAGKSSVLKMIYGNYRCDRGRILVRRGAESLDVAQASPRSVLSMRHDTISYVTQFLRVVPRVSTIDIVAEPLVGAGEARETARKKAAELLRRINVPAPLWGLPPATFSGGEQQRVNIARGFITPHPVLLLDEPTASLDARNREVVVEMISGKKREGVALLGIFHDADVRAVVADTVIDVTRFAPERIAA